ncbi:hypothetical protein [Archangium sp.]|uniref:hypothetical protein n=1 Tax=Archangium sp. TaxID=1872627 RepID=UPI00286D1BB0|nr:hypothetical protein [Archangium sp.]
MRRSRLTQALLLSLALHLGLGLVLYLAPPPKRVPPPTSLQPLQVEVVVRSPPPRAEPPRSEPPAPQAPPLRPPPPRGASRPPPASPPTPPPVTATAPPPASTPPEAPVPDDVPEVPDVPRAVQLFPGPGGLAVPPSLGALPGPGGSTGRTLRPGDGSSSAQLLAEERERVQGRVQGFLDDGMASLRVQNGLVDPFFGDMDRALEKGLSGAPLFAYQGVFKHFFKANPGANPLSELLASAGRYGATGSPDAPGESRGTESMEDALRSGAAGARARSRPSTVDVVDAYSRRAGTLHVELELEQSPSGQVLGVKVLVGSGNPLFDAYVVEHVPKALAGLGPAPEHFSARKKGETVRSAWAVAGHVSFARTLKFSKLDELDASDAAYISALMPFGLLSGNFEETRGEVVIPDFRRPHFDIKTRLLRVYERGGAGEGSSPTPGPSGPQ